MIVQYGYTDGAGDYRIIIDEDKCDGCGECAGACPEALFELYENDYDEEVIRIKHSLVKKIGYLCPGFSNCSEEEKNCHTVCKSDAITHSW